MSSSLSVVEGSGGPTATSTGSGGPSSEQQTQSQSQTQTQAQQQQQPAQQHETTDKNILDFIGSSNAVKDLFSLPYSNDRPVSVAVHNLDGTLLIDSSDLASLVESQDGSSGSRVPSSASRAPQQRKRSSWPLPKDEANVQSSRIEDDDDDDEVQDLTRSLVALSSLEPPSEALTIVNSVIETSRRHRAATTSSAQQTSTSQSKQAVFGVPTPDEYVEQYIPPTPEPREYLSWNFCDLNLLVGSQALIYRSPAQEASSSSSTTTALAVRVEDVDNLQALQKRHVEMVRSGEYVADHDFSKNMQHQQMGNNKPSYAQAAAKSRAEQIEEEKLENDRPVENNNNNNSGERRRNDTFAVPDLGQVQVQTCIVPAGGLLSSGHTAGCGAMQSVESSTSQNGKMSPVSTVIDAYLDNIMANVPQLALCLHAKGFIQSVKLMRTDEIPSGLMHPRTLDTSTPFELFKNADPELDQMFSPQVMEMNASALLRFLKSNCTKDNATYLLRREAGQTNIQLYDISSISAQRQRKWIWWLATMSYRFALRLRHLSRATKESGLSRSFRSRQRSLLENALDLLEVLADMDGVAHESLVSAIRENLADSFLGTEEATETGEAALPEERASSSQQSSAPPEPVSSSSLQKPYGSLPVDALTKAHDHLVQGIKMLWPVLEHDVQRAKKSKQKQKKSATSSDESIADRDESERAPVNQDLQIDAVTTQLFGLHHKLINVSLRLAEIHLRNYFSSSAMQSLRTTSRRIGDSLYLVRLVDTGSEEADRRRDWLQRLQLQYTWLWQNCGHFARSFAADELWRDRGHASGDDVCSTLQDVEASITENKHLKAGIPRPFYRFTRPGADPIARKSNGMSTLCTLSAIVDFRGSNSAAIEESPESHEAMLLAAKALMDKQGLLRRDERKVLVAACISYHRAIDALNDLASWTQDEESTFEPNVLSLLQQRLGDACNETGKLLLTELRSLLTSTAAESSDSGGSKLAADPLLSSAEFWFLEGLAAFGACRDLRNLALLRCNLCQCYKLRANNIFAPRDEKPSDGPTHAETCLQQAADQLQAAHEALGQREVDPMTWDMVSTELAATYLVLGVRRRQSLIGSGMVPLMLQALRLSPGQERSIVDPMERALAIYEQAGNLPQAAAVHYQLALFFSKIWTCQRDETKTREKLAAAFGHYNAAHYFFSRSVQGNEATFCLLCLDTASLYTAVSGEECLAKALQRCLDTVEACSEEIVGSAAQMHPLTARTEWFNKMKTLGESVDERVFKLLRNLVKLEEENAAAQRSTKYKDLYRVGLGAKMTTKVQTDITTSDAELDEIVVGLLTLHKVLREILTQL